MRLGGWIIGGAMALGVLLAGAANADPAPARPDANLIRPDPAVVRGVLPNGLRYAVVHNATPAGGLSVRLVVETGFYDEDQNEREAAHFVEHMAFRNPLTFSGQDIAKAFESMGVGFGHDQNAATTLYTTSYRLDLPRTDDALVDMSFRWLRDIADGINFNQQAVAAERGVILAEHQSRLGASSATLDQMVEFLAPGLRSIERSLPTPTAQIEALDAQRLLAFYQRWYRPENAVLVVVGDLPTEVMLKRIQQSFGSWRGQGPAVARRPFASPDIHRGLDVLTLPARATVSEIEVCSESPPDPARPDDVARLRARAAEDAWQDILDQRLTAIQSKPNAPFFNSRARLERLKELNSVCVVSVFANDAWAPALRAVEAELRRMQIYGPSRAELDSSIDNTRAGYRGGAFQASTRQSADLATSIASTVTDGDIVATPAEDFRAFDTAVETLSPDDVKAAVRKDWSGSGPLLVVLSPNPPKADEVRKVWAEGQGGQLAPAASKPAAAPVWGYPSFGKPGQVVARQDFPKQGFVRLRFANGLVLNFKQTAFEADSVSVRIRFGAGRREIANSDYFTGVLGAMMFAQGGLGRNSYADVVQLFRSNQWSADLSVDAAAFYLTARTVPVGLGDELSILTAYLSDPGFRPDVDPALKATIDTFYRVYRTNPGVAFLQAATDAVAPGSPESVPPKDKAAGLNMSDFARVLKPAVTGAPLELTIVGDVDEKTAVELAAKTLGALPPRPATPRERKDTWFLRYPKTPPPVFHATHEGAKDQAVVGVTWPLYVATPTRRREELALNVLDRAFTDLLRDRLRVELGEAYAPAVELSMPDDADQGAMSAVVEIAPGDVDQAIAEIRKLARKIAGGDLPDDVIETARAPLVASLVASQKTNAYWLNGLSGSEVRDPELTDLMSLLPLARSVTPAEVRKAAADWLSAEPVVVILTPAAASSPAQGAKR